ncbi:MAG: GLPGLI family protein [Prevotellaceae bacterium]|jgi:GLPGLI family protein|nr:GLPGLI family protein [Prevotellaceae bacterium]
MKNITIKKKILLCCVIIFTITNANAQFHYRSPLIKIKVDVCNYYVTYTYKFVNDTIKKEPYYDKQALEIGDSIIKYSSIYVDIRDSIFIEFSNNKGKHRQNKNGSDGINPNTEAGLKANEKAIYEDYYVNYPTKKMLSVSTGMWGKEYLYEEPVPKFEWKFHPDTTTILGYKCMKATTTFRGRNYEVWFTPFIPIRYGPWKFNGLPGLILKATDTKGYFEWIAIGFEKPQNKDLYVINFEKISKGTHFVKTDRKSVIKLLHKRWSDPVGLGLSNLPDGFRGMYTLSDPLTSAQVIISHDIPSSKNVQFSYIPIPELE